MAGEYGKQFSALYKAYEQVGEALENLRKELEKDEIESAFPDTQAFALEKLSEIDTALTDTGLADALEEICREGADDEQAMERLEGWGYV